MSRRSKTAELSRLVTTDELQLYKVLLDETRESILNYLANSPKGVTATELSKDFDLKLPTIMSHMTKLERVGAVKRRERRGRHVNRPVVYYRAAVKVGKFRERLGQIEAAIDYFKQDLSEVVLQFLQRRSDVVPKLEDPASLWEWLELLLKKTGSAIPEIVVQQPDRLAAIPKLQHLAAKVAALSLLNDCQILLLEEAVELAEARSPKLAEVAKKYGVRKVRDVGDAFFLFEIVEDLLSKNDSKRFQAQVALTQLVEMLPSSLSWKSELKEILPYIARAGEVLDEKSADSLYDFSIVDKNISSMVVRWKESAKILRAALQKPLAPAAK